MARIQTFRAFWPYYVSQHMNASCRRWHFVGTSCALVSLTLLAVTGHWWWLPIGLVSSYGPAWIGHFFIEKNRPATFQYPFWSLAADFIMYGKMWTGAMDAEVAQVTATTKA